MFNNFKSMLTICLLAFASMQTAQAVMVYGSTGPVIGTSTTSAILSVTDYFSVTGGSTYEATLTDIGMTPSPLFDNFNALSMIIFSDTLAVVESPLTLSPTAGSGAASVSFSFTALLDATYTVILAGSTDALSVYTATITTPLVAGDPVTSVPVPSAIWFLGTGMFALVGFGRRKSV